MDDRSAVGGAVAAGSGASSGAALPCRYAINIALQSSHAEGSSVACSERSGYACADPCPGTDAGSVMRPLASLVTAAVPSHDRAPSSPSQPPTDRTHPYERFSSPDSLRKTLFDTARKAGYTTDGELFHTGNMMALLRDHCGAECTLLPVPWPVQLALPTPAPASSADAAAAAAVADRPEDAGAAASTPASVCPVPAEASTTGPVSAEAESGSTGATTGTCTGTGSSTSTGFLAAVAHAVRTAIDRGDVLLIAYDTDGTRGHVPVCKGGASAHWGLITGYVQSTGSAAAAAATHTAPSVAHAATSSCVDAGCPTDTGSASVASGGLHPGASVHSASARAASADSYVDDESNVFVILQHSLSAAPVVCPLSQLLASNAQLTAPNARKARLGGWVIGDDGPALRGIIHIAMVAR